MRDLILEKMYDWSSHYYMKYFRKNNPWTVSSKELFLYPQESIGFHLSCFHLKYNLEMKPNLEEHDVFHVLTGTGISVAEEVALQYYLLGNGKKGAFMSLAIAGGTLFYPFHIREFIQYYQRGKSAHQFYDLDFKNMLYQSVSEIQYTFNIK